MNDLAVTATLSPIRRTTGIDPAQIRGRRVREKIFIAFGLASTLIGLIALSLLLYDLAHEGLGRLSWDFFTNFPSRRASQAGILSAWVGSMLIILVTALIAVPLGVGAGIYLGRVCKG
jgi:phosphate transport system permease protein